MTSQPSGRPSLSVSGLFISVPAFCSSALVRPSPSQSAPPSSGFRGSEPDGGSALTPVDPAIITRSRAINILVFFFFCIFISLPNSVQRTRCSLFPASVRAEDRREGLGPGGSDGSLELTDLRVLRLTKRCTERRFARLQNLLYLCLLLLYYSSILTGFHREPTVPSDFGAPRVVFQGFP